MRIAIMDIHDVGPCYVAKPTGDSRGTVVSKPNHWMMVLGICNKLTWPIPAKPVTLPLLRQQPMTSTDVLVAGVMGALFAPPAREYVIFTALGVVIVCVTLATTIEVRMTTAAAKTMTNHREDFWICILIAFICVCSNRVLTR
jgi:hypothetical protein